MDPRLPDRRSLRYRLMFLAMLVIGATMLVAGASLVLIFERHILKQVAADLDVRWIEIAGAVELSPGGRLETARPQADPRYDRPLSGAYWQVDEAGRTILRSRSLWDQQLAIPANPGAEAYETADFEGDGEFYVLTRPLVMGEEGGERRFLISVAIDHAGIDALQTAFRDDLTWTLGILFVVLAAGAFVQIHVGLRPLAALRQAIHAIRSGSTERLGPGFASEVQPLADDVDRLLDRQDALVAKARDRAGTLAHGLKTPLTILQLEAAKLEAAGQRSAAAVIADQAGAMRLLVERELARARVRGGSATTAVGAGRASDLAEVAGRIVDVMARMPRAGDLDIAIEIEPGLRVRLDRHDLGEVLGNLVDNARKWAASRITLRARRDGDAVELEVVDDGPGLAAASADAEGSGLGLAIVDDVLAEYGTVLRREQRAGETAMCIRLPAVPRPSRSSLRAAAE